MKKPYSGSGGFEKPLDILLVEDEAINAMTFEMELQEAGHRVVKTVSSGERAVEALPQLKPDLILMDIRLAGKWDGIETARRMRKILPVPIIFITGYADEELVEKTKTFDSVRYVTKPLKMEDLLSTIHSLVGCGIQRKPGRCAPS
jgi:two-component system, response regulator PdtaR